MRKPVLLCMTLFLVALSVAFWSACGSQQPASAPQPEYAPTATIKDIMDAIIDPSADVVWESVQTIVTPAGTDERMPKNDEEWAAVRRGALRVVEGTNLLMMPGRHVARPHEKSETPGVELEPEEIEANINKDRAQWNKLAKGLYETSMEALKAIEAKDVSALIDIGGRMDTACENCHMTYWYPNQPLPPADDPRFKTITPNK
jgi:hypothetical protein